MSLWEEQKGAERELRKIGDESGQVGKTEPLDLDIVISLWR